MRSQYGAGRVRNPGVNGRICQVDRRVVGAYLADGTGFAQGLDSELKQILSRTAAGYLGGDRNYPRTATVTRH